MFLTASENLMYWPDWAFKKNPYCWAFLKKLICYHPYILC